MKLKDLGELILFDILPMHYDPKKRIILTHLLYIDKLVLPEKMCKMITTKNIAQRFKNYCHSKGYKGLTKDSFFYVEPYTETDIVVDRRRPLKMLFCESDDLSGNLMVLIKEDNKLNYIYAGNFTDIRTAVLNETYISWIEPNPPQYLYLNLKRSEEDRLAEHVDDNKQVFNNIQKILENHLNYGINLYVPKLGYEYFIQILAKTLSKRVALSPNFKTIFDPNNDALDYLLESTENAKIVLCPGDPNYNDIRLSYKMQHRITVKIQRKNALKFSLEPGKFYYELFYKPEPSPFVLQMCCALIRPKRIYGIIDTNNINTNVPKYLIALCVGNEEYSESGQEKKLRNSIAVDTESTKDAPDKNFTVGPLVNDKVKPGIFLDSDSDSSL